MLCDTSRSVAIGQLAELLCFADASTFGRAFRREFGMSPSEARNAALARCHPTVSLRWAGVPARGISAMAFGCSGSWRFDLWDVRHRTGTARQRKGLLVPVR